MELLRWVLAAALLGSVMVLFALPRLGIVVPGYVTLGCWLVMTAVAVLFSYWWFDSKKPEGTHSETQKGHADGGGKSG